ncbi:unnamed protein product, partial [Ixodes hexagonus]
ASRGSSLSAKPGAGDRCGRGTCGSARMLRASQSRTGGVPRHRGSRRQTSVVTRNGLRCWPSVSEKPGHRQDSSRRVKKGPSAAPFRPDPARFGSGQQVCPLALRRTAGGRNPCF